MINHLDLNLKSLFTLQLNREKKYEPDDIIDGYFHLHDINITIYLISSTPSNLHPLKLSFESLRMKTFWCKKNFSSKSFNSLKIFNFFNCKQTFLSSSKDIYCFNETNLRPQKDFRAPPFHCIKWTYNLENYFNYRSYY